MFIIRIQPDEKLIGRMNPFKLNYKTFPTPWGQHDTQILCLLSSEMSISHFCLKIGRLIHICQIFSGLGFNMRKTEEKKGPYKRLQHPDIDIT